MIVWGDVAGEKIIEISRLYGPFALGGSFSSPVRVTLAAVACFTRGSAVCPLLLLAQ